MFHGQGLGAAVLVALAADALPKPSLDQAGAVLAVAAPLALPLAYIRRLSRERQEGSAGSEGGALQAPARGPEGVQGGCPACGAAVVVKQTAGGRCMACGEVLAVARDGRIVPAPDPPV